MALLKDEKPITVCQSIQALGKSAQAKPDLNERIANMLISIDLAKVKECCCLKSKK